MEMEADEVGLVLAAKACFDVRMAPQFWGKMAVTSEEPLANEVNTTITYMTRFTRKGSNSHFFFYKANQSLILKVC